MQIAVRPAFPVHGVDTAATESVSTGGRGLLAVAAGHRFLHSLADAMSGPTGFRSSASRSTMPSRTSRGRWAVGVRLNHRPHNGPYFENVRPLILSTACRTPAWVTTKIGTCSPADSARMVSHAVWNRSAT